jgi:hypothetical protein
MRVSRRFVIAYMALVSILSAALVVPLVVAVILSPEPIDSEDGYLLAALFGGFGTLWVIGMAAGLVTLRRLRD